MERFKEHVRTTVILKGIRSPLHRGIGGSGGAPLSLRLDPPKERESMIDLSKSMCVLCWMETGFEKLSI